MKKRMVLMGEAVDFSSELSVLYSSLGSQIMARIKATRRSYSPPTPKKHCKPPKQRVSKEPDDNPLLSTSSIIRRTVQYFDNFFDDERRIDEISSHVWTLSNWRSFRNSVYNRACSLFQRIYHSYYYIMCKSMRVSGGWLIGKQGKFYLLKELLGKMQSKQVQPHVWQISDEDFTLCGLESEILELFQEILGSVHKMEFVLERIVLIECGGYLELEDDRERMIIQFPTEFTGGEFTVVSENKTEILQPPVCWVYGKFARKQQPVTSGYQFLLVGFVQPTTKINQPRCGSNDLVTGPPAPAPDTIRAIAEELDGETVGLILSDKYNDKPEYDFGMLTGTDKYLMDNMSSLGCRLELKSVLFCKTEDGSKTAPMSEVYLWTSDHANYLLGKGPEPSLAEIPPSKIPFFDLGECKRYICSRTLWDYDLDYLSDDSDGTPDGCNRPKGEIVYYLAPALIIHFPTWWARARLLWIAKMKNNPSECPLVVLPKDVIRLICANLREDNTRKRKRFEMEDDEAESDNSSDSSAASDDE